MYIIPPYRFTIYAFGILLAYLLRRFKSFELSSHQIRIGWSLSGACLIFIVSICLFNQNYSPFGAAMFSAFTPIPLSIILMWIIFTAQMGHKSKASALNCNYKSHPKSVSFHRLSDQRARVEIFQGLHKCFLWHLPGSVCCLSLQCWKIAKFVAFQHLWFFGEILILRFYNVRLIYKFDLLD